MIYTLTKQTSGVHAVSFAVSKKLSPTEVICPFCCLHSKMQVKNGERNEKLTLGINFHVHYHEVIPYKATQWHNLIMLAAPQLILLLTACFPLFTFQCYLSEAKWEKKPSRMLSTENTYSKPNKNILFDSLKNPFLERRKKKKRKRKEKRSKKARRITSNTWQLHVELIKENKAGMFQQNTADMGRWGLSIQHSALGIQHFSIQHWSVARTDLILWHRIEIGRRKTKRKMMKAIYSDKRK